MLFHFLVTAMDQSLDHDGTQLHRIRTMYQPPDYVKSAAQEAIQMHGGIGMTDEFDIGFFLKRVRVGQELFGDDNYHADQIARQRAY